MNRTTIIISVAAAVILAGCTSSGSDDPNATATEAYEGYADWQRVNVETISGDATGLLGRAHEGSTGFREVYVNAVGREVSFGEANAPYPEGTIIVKESYGSNSGEKGSLSGITIMAKREPGYDPEHGNWEYINLRANMKVQAQGALSGCISCHAAAERDFVFTDAR